MSQRYVTVLGKPVALGAYVQGVKLAIANPGAEFKTGLTSWWPTTGAEVRRQFMRGVMDRINQGVSYAERGKA